MMDKVLFKKIMNFAEHFFYIEDFIFLYSVTRLSVTQAERYSG